MSRKDHSPITEVVVPFAVEMCFCKDGFNWETCRESKVIWSVAPESIIQVLLITGVRVLRALLGLTEVAICAEDSFLRYVVEDSAIAVFYPFLVFFFRVSHQSGYPMISKHCSFVWPFFLQWV